MTWSECFPSEWNTLSRLRFKTFKPFQSFKALQYTDRTVNLHERPPVGLTTARLITVTRCVKSYSPDLLESVIPECIYRESRRLELDLRLKHSGVTPLGQILIPIF